MFNSPWTVIFSMSLFFVKCDIYRHLSLVQLWNIETFFVKKFDKQSFAVALAVKGNGEKLPPKVRFKDVWQLNINTPPRTQISVQKKGWMDEEVMFYVHTLFREETYRASDKHDSRNSKRGLNDCIVVMDRLLYIMLLFPPLKCST